MWTKKDSRWRERKYREVFKPAYDEFIKLYPFGLKDLPSERWAPIDGYDAYHVSSFGRVKSFKLGIVKILKPSLDTGGYLVVALYRNGKQKTVKVARLVATVFIPNPQGKPEVNHLHGRFNNYIGSLEWATNDENMEHAVRTGLVAQGENHPHAKLTEEQVFYIRENPEGLTTYQLGDMFGVDPRTVGVVQCGSVWQSSGGTLREARKRRFLTDEEKALIRAEYRNGVRGCGAPALAKKYNIGSTTVYRLLKD